MSNNRNDEIGRIYMDTFDFTYRYIYSHIGNKAWTEELVSDTYMTFVELFDNYDHSSKPSTFIIGIAINKLREFYRNNKTKLQSEYGEELFELLCEGIDDESLDEPVENQDKGNHKIVVKLLEELPEKYRSVLEARFLKGLDTVQTAKELGISVGNVRIIQLRALKKLKSLASL